MHGNPTRPGYCYIWSPLVNRFVRHPYRGNLQTVHIIKVYVSRQAYFSLYSYEITVCKPLFFRDLESIRFNCFFLVFSLNYFFTGSLQKTPDLFRYLKCYVKDDKYLKARTITVIRSPFVNYG